MAAGLRFSEVLALLLVILSLYTVLPLTTKGYLFDSIAHLKTLVDLENNLGEKLKAYVTSQQGNSKKVKSFANLVENATNLAKAQGPAYVDNPINAYSIIKRFTDDWRRLDSLLVSEDHAPSNDLIDTLNITKAKVLLQDDHDLIGAIAALFRLQTTYNISAKTMIEGKIPACQPSSPMTVEDCYEIGTVAYRGYQFTRSREWLREAVRLVKEGHPQGSTSLRSILEYLAWVEYLTGNIEEAWTLTEELLKIAPTEQKFLDNERIYRHLLEYDLPLSHDQIKAREERINTETYINSTYARVCRGDPIEPRKHQNKLRCWYHGRHIPALVIRPAKLELINLKPKIYIFRDIVTDYEATTIKKLASPILERATVYNLEKNVLETAEYRVSKSAWIDERKHEVVAKVNRRASLITELDHENSEWLQVANYGMGGQYEEHVDFGDPNSPLASDPHGNRVATLLIYLNDVAAGGGTGFMNAGLNIPPTKGDAVFWFNLKRSGEGDNSTLHAGCPVLCGNKWVANKWFREGGTKNMFNRPCARDRNL